MITNAFFLLLGLLVGTNCTRLGKQLALFLAGGMLGYGIVILLLNLGG